MVLYLMRILVLRVVILGKVGLILANIYVCVCVCRTKRYFKLLIVYDLTYVSYKPIE